METEVGAFGTGAVYILGNFLSGMETQELDELPCRIRALETSLVEWKPVGVGEVYATFYPLETSLVEWKQANPCEVYTARTDLGNFLSGMETCRTPSRGTLSPLPWKLP